MSVRRVLSVLLGTVLACAVFLPAAHAQWYNPTHQLTKLTFSQPVQVSNVVLPAGTYWFRIADFGNLGNLNTIQVLNKNMTKVYTTVQTISTQRPNPTGKTVIEFTERPHNQPVAMYKWFYPGFVTGHEFVYPAREEMALRHEAKQEVQLAQNRPETAVPVR